MGSTDQTHPYCREQTETSIVLMYSGISTQSTGLSESKQGRMWIQNSAGLGMSKDSVNAGREKGQSHAVRSICVATASSSPQLKMLKAPRHRKMPHSLDCSSEWRAVPWPPVRPPVGNVGGYTVSETKGQSASCKDTHHKEKERGVVSLLVLG